ncbi:hypothetical protein CSC22_5230 (plasmid) [Escherichia coli]|nr:hypothetical protein CSC22_5230 [Escherichia coli]
MFSGEWRDIIHAGLPFLSAPAFCLLALRLCKLPLFHHQHQRHFQAMNRR